MLYIILLLLKTSSSSLFRRKNEHFELCSTWLISYYWCCCCCRCCLYKNRSCRCQTLFIIVHFMQSHRQHEHFSSMCVNISVLFIYFFIFAVSAIVAWYQSIVSFFILKRHGVLYVFEMLYARAPCDHKREKEWAKMSAGMRERERGWIQIIERCRLTHSIQFIWNAVCA